MGLVDIAWLDIVVDKQRQMETRKSNLSAAFAVDSSASADVFAAAVGSYQIHYYYYKLFEAALGLLETARRLEVALLGVSD